MSAVAEISKPETAVVFTAPREALRLVKYPRYPVFGPGGRQVGEEKGQTLCFRDGMLRVPPEGILLEDGARMPAAEALEWLRGHRLCGNTQDGFTELQQATPPVSQDEIAAMMAAAWDEDALVAIVEAERAGWKRPALLEPAERALERLRVALAQAQQAAAETPAPAPKAKAAAKRAAG